MPTPLSEIVTRICESTRSIRASTRPPAGVNLTAFESRFQNTWRSRSASPFIRGGSPDTVRSSVISLASAAGRTVSIASRRIREITTGCRRRRSRPVMTRDTSRTSEISCACDCALRATISSTFGMRAASTRRSRSSDTQPRMALSGVRSSCDKRGEELVLQPVGALRVVAGALGVLARRLERDEHVAQLVLPAASAQRGADRADHGRHADRPVEQRDVAHHLERAQRADRRLAPIVSGEEQQRHVRPGRLGLQRRRQLVDARVGQRLLGQEHGARALADFLAQLARRWRRRGTARRRSSAAAT